MKREVRRHLVDQTPSSSADLSGVLCINAGDCKPGQPLSEGERSFHGWTLTAAKVSCPRCLEWMHA